MAGLQLENLDGSKRDTARAMSEENVETLRRGYEAVNRGDIARSMRRLTRSTFSSDIVHAVSRAEVEASDPSRQVL